MKAPERPVPPDARVGSQAEMREAELAAGNYLTLGSACLDFGVMNRRQHNRLLVQVEIFSDEAREIAVFRGRADNEQVGMLEAAADR
jgi:hypothetical protein